MLIFWLFVFVLSLAVLVKSADLLIEGAEKIGLALRIPSFIVGVTIVAVGTSLPELASSLASVFKGATEIVCANVIGSNIANIFLVVGLAAVVGRRLSVKRDIIDLDLPLLASTTALLAFVILDKKVVWQEGVLFLVAFLVYLLYTFQERKNNPEEEKKETCRKISFRYPLFVVLGGVGLFFGADYLIEAVLKLSDILKIGTSVIAILGVAVGTSLPELVVSAKSAAQRKYEIALGNIFGSNVFNSLVVIGIPSLIKKLTVDSLTLIVGFPFMLVATLLLVISGITKRISVWEGLMFLLIYFLFVIKVFGLF